MPDLGAHNFKVRRARPRKVSRRRSVGASVSRAAPRSPTARRNPFVGPRPQHSTPRARRIIRQTIAKPAPKKKPVRNVFNDRGGRIGDQTRHINVRGDMTPEEALEGQARLRGARRSTAAQADLLWKLVHRSYGGKMPSVRVRGYPGGRPEGGALGWANIGSDTANVDPGLAMSAAGVNPWERAGLQKVLLHEWAHNRQKGRYKPSEHEGGAEAFARDLARKIGLKDQNRTYRPQVRKFRAKHSGSYLKRGQFK